MKNILLTIFGFAILALGASGVIPSQVLTVVFCVLGIITMAIFGLEPGLFGLIHADIKLLDARRTQMIICNARGDRVGDWEGNCIVLVVQSGNGIEQWVAKEDDLTSWELMSHHGRGNYASPRKSKILRELAVNFEQLDKPHSVLKVSV